MATQTLNELANNLLSSIEGEKTAELSKTASLSHTPTMKTVLGLEMQKVAATLRSVASAEITAEDVAEFRRRYGV